MRRPRVIVLAVLAGLVYGSLLATGGYAWYLRSDGYRKSCAARLSDSLRLPAEIGRVVPRSRNAREFQDVRVWLPERRGEAAYCRRAIVVGQPTANDADAYELQLLGGWCEISTRTWLREDYRTVLESGLRPGFDPDGPRRVVFSGMDLTFEHQGFRAALRDAHGVVAFENPVQGWATVHCNEFNGHTTADAVVLRVEFSPQAPGVRLDRVELIVPELPIAIVGLEDLAGLGLRTGSFSGRVQYRETDGHR